MSARRTTFRFLGTAIWELLAPLATGGLKASRLRHYHGKKTAIASVLQYRCSERRLYDACRLIAGQRDILIRHKAG